MSIAAYGFARPIAFEDVVDGMLILAAPGEHARFFGVVCTIDDTKALMELWSPGNPPVPNLLDLVGVQSDLLVIPGTLEVEPLDEPFQPGSTSRLEHGYAIDSFGRFYAVSKASHFVRTQYCRVDLANGQLINDKALMRYFQAVRLFIRQEGREKRFEWPPPNEG